jgi:hypothetical protein
MDFDPALLQGDKLNVNPSAPAPLEPVTLKARLAGLVRADSAERRAPTQEHAFRQLAPEAPAERWSELLAEMAAEAAYADIKAVVAPSGRVYLFSQPTLARNDAAERCLVEEAKIAIAEKVRGDSRYVALTPMADLERLFPSPEPEKRAALLAELQADARFEDIQGLAGPDGGRCFHSERYMSSNYGRIMARAGAGDPADTIVAFVRDRSREMTAPTNTTVFQDRVFALSAAQIAAFVDGLGKPDAAPEQADVKRLVHPITGAVYLYSERWIDEASASRIMDWEEVGRSQNP